MLQGLEIMLERMKTHPEEFVAQNKYTKAIHRVRPFLNDEELNALRDAVVVAHRDYFNGEVLSIISGEENTARITAYDDTSFANVVMSDKVEGYSSDYFAKAILRGMNAPTAPSAFGAVPIKAEGAFVTYKTGGQQ
jgi:hypothetical protein